MKNLFLTIALLIVTGATGQLAGVNNYKKTASAENGVKSKVNENYVFKFDYMTWGAQDLGNVIEECERILEANGADFNAPDLDESTIEIGTEGFYDIQISSLIFEGYAIRKAWGIDNDENSYYAVTMIASLSKIELLIVKMDK